MLLGYTKVSKKTSSVGSCVHGKNSIYFKVNETLWITLHPAKHYYSTLLSVILRLLIKNGWHGWRASCIWTVNFKRLQEVEFHGIKGALSSLRPFLASGRLSKKMMKNVFYFTLKALLSFSRYWNFLSWIFGHVKKRLE